MFDSVKIRMLRACVCVRVHVCRCDYRCEDMVDVRRLKMLQMVQLFKCEEDSLQVLKNTMTKKNTEKKKFF